MCIPSENVHFWWVTSPFPVRMCIPGEMCINSESHPHSWRVSSSLLVRMRILGEDESQRNKHHNASISNNIPRIKSWQIKSHECIMSNTIGFEILKLCSFRILSLSHTLHSYKYINSHTWRVSLTWHNFSFGISILCGKSITKSRNWPWVEFDNVARNCGIQ